MTSLRLEYRSSPQLLAVRLTTRRNVSTRINHVANDDEACSTPVERAQTRDRYSTRISRASQGFSSQLHMRQAPSAHQPLLRTAGSFAAIACVPFTSHSAEANRPNRDRRPFRDARRFCRRKKESRVPEAVLKPSRNHGRIGFQYSAGTYFVISTLA